MFVNKKAKQPRHLTVARCGFLDYGDDRWQADYIAVTIRVVMLRSQMVVDDHIPVGCFVRLHDLLVGFRGGLSGSETIGSADGQLELAVEWREVERDVRFTGRIPGFDFTELVDQPLKLREGIYRVLSFQFALELTALDQPIAQLKAFLDLLRSLKPHPENPGG